MHSSLGLGVHLIRAKRVDAKEKSAAAIVNSLPEPQRSTLQWLLDLCVEVVQKANVNKMTAQNMAIVFGPNLFTPQLDNPMESLLYSQKVANFLHKAILHRQQLRQSGALKHR